MALKTDEIAGYTSTAVVNGSMVRAAGGQMRALISVIGLAIGLAALQAPAAAQWPEHPDRNVPRLPDGTTDLEAPAPRTSDGHPDLSGVWANIRDVGFGRGGQPDRQLVSWDEVPMGSFRDLGVGFENGLPLQAWAKTLKDERMAANSKDNPDVWCLPLGNQQFNFHTFPRKIIQNPDVIVILYETHMGLRQIFTDGRSLPDNDPQPFWFGYSVGRWEGDTLVVETSHYRGDEWLDINGSPLTEQGRTVERFRRINTGTLEIEITVDDPKAYTRPFTVKARQRLLPDTELIEMICLENNRSIEHLDF
jgi:hypothetical protein